MKRFLLALCVVLVATAPLRAQGVELHVEAGWDGACPDEGWVPLRVTATAPAGSAPTRGRLVCETVPLERVAGSEARFALTATKDAPAVATITLAVPARGDLSFTVIAEDERGHELARAVPRDLPRRVDPKDRLVLLVGRRSGFAALETAASGPAPARPPHLPPSAAGQNRPGTVRVARIEPEQLPDRSWLLAGTAAVILAEGPGMVELARDEARMEALEAYVRHGAALVVVGGHGVAFWSGSRLEQLLPVRAGGSTAAASAHDLGFTASAAKDVSVSRAKLRDDVKAELTAGSEELPIAVRRPLGRGSVVFLAFDPDNLEVRGAPELAPFLARQIPPPRPKPHHVRPDRLTEVTTRALNEKAALGPFGLLGLAAAAAAALVILGPIGARRKNAPARVLVAPALAALLAAVVILVAALTRPATEVTVIAYGFVESDEDHAIVIEDASVLAGGSTTVDVELVGHATVLPLETPKVDLLAFRNRRPDLRIEAGAPPRIPGVPLSSRGLATFRVGGFAKLPARLVARRDGTLLHVEAQGGPLPAGIALHEDPMTHALVTCATPALAAGESRDVVLEGAFAAQRLWDENAPPLWERSADERVRGQLVRALALIADEIPFQLPQKQGPIFARTWVALPVSFEPLVRVVERGAPLAPSQVLSVLLVAAEERP